MKSNSAHLRWACILLVVLLVAATLSACNGTEKSPEEAARSLQVPTQTPAPTQVSDPTPTPEPIETPVPTQTPAPTPTPTTNTNARAGAGKDSNDSRRVRGILR